MAQNQTLPKMNQKIKLYFFKHVMVLKSNDFVFLKLKKQS